MDPRAQLLQALREAIVSSRYHVDPQAVAVALLERLGLLTPDDVGSGTASPPRRRP